MACENCKSGKWLNGYRSKLSAKLAADDSLLPVVDRAALAAKLIDGHTYLLIDDGTGGEIVRAESFGKEVKITRGAGGTEAKAFPAGACVKWEVTEMAILETVCGADCEKAADDCGCGGV